MFRNDAFNLVDSGRQICGLQYKKKYETKEDLKTLRYGKIMIMTDQVGSQ